MVFNYQDVPGYSANYSSLNSLSGTFANAFQNGLNSNRSQDSTNSVWRYPLGAIDKSMDMLLIRIYRRVDDPKNQFNLNDMFVRKHGVKDGEIIKDADGNNVEFIRGLKKLPSRTERFNQASSNEQSEMKKNSRYIWLPIPQQISDTLAVSYAEDTMNPLQSLGLAAAADGIRNPVQTAGAVMKLLKDASPDFIARNENLLTTVLGGAAINQLGANVNPQSLITRASGQILQSNLELLFSGVTLRTFPFVFDFTPRNPDEAQTVKEIIRVIKSAMVPSKGDGVFINSPDLFQFEFVGGKKNDSREDHPFLNKFKVGVLTDVNVNYTASGTYATYEDGTPVHIRLQMTLKEINPIYKEDYDSELGQIGVGY